MEARQRDWPELRDRLHSRWPALSEDELDDTGGDRDSLVALLEAKYGYARENAEGDLRLVMETPVAPGPFVAEDSDDPENVAESGTIDRALERDLELSTGLRSHYLQWPHEGARMMLLLHGLGGSAADWRRVAAHFQGRFRVIALDQRGHGWSHISGGGYTADQHTADIEAFVDAAGLERPILVGHSMGAYHALSYAAAHPEKVTAVVVSGLHSDGSDSEPDGVATRVYGSAQEYVDAMRRSSPSAPDWALWSLAGARLREVRGGFQPRAEPAAVESWRAPEIVSRAGTIDVPVLVIESGESREGEGSLPAAIADAEREHLPSGGHDPYIDAESEYLTAIDRFLAARGISKEVGG